MLYTTMTRSKYYYEDSPVLINHFGLRDLEKLTSIETDISFNRLSELIAKPIKGRFGWAHLSKIHAYIFADIYPFAGKSRNENIIKGSTHFCSCEYIHPSIEKMVQELKNERFLQGLSQKQISKRLAYYMAELNMIHPFREGNGRTIREYIRCLAIKNGYHIRWDCIDKESLLFSTILSVDKGCDELVECIDATMGNHRRIPYDESKK
jgi:cell filamentation protein